MTNLLDVFQPRGIGAAVAAKCVVTANEAGDVYVVIPSFDLTHRWGPCPFMPKGTDEPQPDDEGLVVFDEEREPWLVVW